MSEVHVVTSTGELEKKTGPELIAIFNSLNPPQKVKRFSTHAAGVKRTLELLAKQQAKPPIGTPEPVAAPVVKVPRKKVRPFDLPGRAGVEKEPRLGSKIATLRDRLLVGATFGDLMIATSWDKQVTYQEIVRTNRDFGYTISETAGGVIKAAKS